VDRVRRYPKSLDNRTSHLVQDYAIIVDIERQGYVKLAPSDTLAEH
jgi:hypothetical protein